jgi:hypothetical protein
MEAKPVKRVMLVQRRVGGRAGAAPVRRFSLARVGPSTVSALGVDRFERMEEVARMDEARTRLGGDRSP